MTTIKVGQLAKHSGLTVCTLHHYDAIGLLSPARRSPVGYRLYGQDDVARLTLLPRARIDPVSIRSNSGRPLQGARETS
jgi:DNA-binding transcriptional MerR regulator